MRRLLTPTLFVLLPLAFFLALFDARTLDVTNIGWLIRGTDNGENALGLHAYRYDAASGLGLRTGLLNAPDGVPVLYTDSNPLAALLVKPIGRWLPADFQAVGWVILISLVLQTVFAWLLLRRHAPGRLALWAGVVLLAFPPALANRFIHANLMAHWTILAALWLFLGPRRGRGLRWWLPLIVVTELIHSYLLVMVGAIWATALLHRFFTATGRERLRCIGEGAAMLVAVAIVAWLLGVGGQEPAGNFGRFSMPLDALWNAQIQSFSRLLPASEQSPGRGFEGFNYLGAGGLVLIVVALVAARRLPARADAAAAGARLRVLAPTLIVFAILAILHVPLSPTMAAILDPVRASGRLFWPVGYVLVLMAVLAVYRLSAARAGLVLVAAIAIQVVDLSGMAQAIHAQTAEARAHRPFKATPDPRWGALIADARSIAFIPGDVTTCLDVYQEVAWRAVKLRRPVTSVYAARTPRATTERLAREAEAFSRGDLVPGRLYILQRNVPVPAAAAGHEMTLDGVTVIPASALR